MCRRCPREDRQEKEVKGIRTTRGPRPCSRAGAEFGLDKVDIYETSRVESGAAPTTARRCTWPMSARLPGGGSRCAGSSEKAILQRHSAYYSHVRGRTGAAREGETRTQLLLVVPDPKIVRSTAQARDIQLECNPAVRNLL